MKAPVQHEVPVSKIIPTNGHNGHNGHAAEEVIELPAPVDVDLAEMPGPPGLVPCDKCATRARLSEKGDHYSVHYPSPRAIKPCERSWPPKPPGKKVELAAKADCVHGVPWDDCGACGTKKLPP